MSNDFATKARQLAYWHAGDDLQALRTRLACIAVLAAEAGGARVCEHGIDLLRGCETCRQESAPAAAAFTSDRYWGNAERARIVAKAAKIRADVAQQFTDAASWNRNSPHAAISPLTFEQIDPGGKMRRLAAELDALLQEEMPLLYLPAPPPIREVKR